MAHALIFNELPATFPEKDAYKGRSAAGSILVHALMIGTVLLVPLLLPEHIEYARLVAFIAPPLPPPPPPPPPAAVQLAGMAKPVIAIQPKIKLNADALVMPTAIPREVSRIVDEPGGVGEVGGVVGGVPGGLAGGVVGGILHSILSSNAKPPEVAPPPPPPPPPPVAVAPPPPKPVAPAAPVRVGGDVREPKPMKVVPPVYPKLALKARVHGAVILEATLTADGTVEQIRVSSGHPLLQEAAVDAVKQWRYEPTYLNGSPVSVIFTVTVNFELAPTS